LRYNRHHDHQYEKNYQKRKTCHYAISFLLLMSFSLGERSA
jgi:hypothetical protein